MATGRNTNEQTPAASNSSGIPAGSSRPRSSSGSASRRERALGDEEADRTTPPLQRHAAPQIVVDVMRQLVREHDFNLVVGVIGEQGVREQDAAGAAHARQGGVGFLGVRAQRPFVDAADPRAGADRQLHQPVDQRRSLERLERVEDRHAAAPAPVARSHHDGGEPGGGR